MIHSRYQLLLTASVITVSAFMLTSCANPIDQLLERGAESALEQLITEGSGGAVELDQDGGLTIETEDGERIEIGASAELPSDWPNLPVPQGTLLTSYSTSDGWALTVLTSESGVNQLLTELEGSGFAQAESLDMGEMKSQSLTSSAYRVTISWFADDGDGVRLQYMVHPAS